MTRPVQWRAVAILLTGMAASIAAAADEPLAEGLSILGREVRIGMTRSEALQLFEGAELQCVDPMTALDDCDTVNVSRDGRRAGSLQFESARLRVAFRHWYLPGQQPPGAGALFDALFAALSQLGADGRLAPIALSAFEQRREADLTVRNVYLVRGRREFRISRLDPPAGSGAEAEVTVTETLR